MKSTFDNVLSTGNISTRHIKQNKRDVQQTCIELKPKFNVLCVPNIVTVPFTQYKISQARYFFTRYYKTMLLVNKTNTVTNIKLKSEPMGLANLEYKILE